MSYIVIRGHIEVDQQAAASDQLSPETNLACLWNVAIRSLAYCWGWDKDDEREVSIPVREPPSLAANEDWTRAETRIDIDQVRPELRFAIGWRDGQGYHRSRTELGLPS